MSHHCTCGKYLHKAAPVRGRPLPDTLTPREVQFAKALQNYMGIQYGRMEAHGFQDISVASIPQDIRDELHRLSEGYIGVYAERAGNDAARQVGVNITDFVDRPRVQQAFRDEAYKFLRAVDNTTKRNLGTTLAEGTKAGDSIKELAARVKTTLGFDADKKVYVPAGLDADTELDNMRAERIARTESAQAITLGEREGWKETGVVSGVTWVTATDCCEFCREIDGMTVPMDGLFFNLGESLTITNEKGKPQTMRFDYREISGPPLHPFCMLAETPVLAPDCISGISARYRGPIVEILLSDGRRLSVTPNHMLMTDYGFIPAQFLSQGDNVIASTDGNGKILISPDDNRNPTRIDNVVKSLSESFGMFDRSMPASTEYLHGDARFSNGNINIVRANSVLRRDTSIPIDAVSMIASQPLGKKSFTRHDARTVKLNVSVNHVAPHIRNLFPTMQGCYRSRSTHTCFDALVSATDGGLSSLRELLAFAGARMFHPHKHPFAPVTDVYSKLTESCFQRSARISEAVRKCLHTFSSFITPLQIARVNIRYSDTHVYDLQCFSTMYISNGILSSNCRCACEADLAYEYKPKRDE